MRPIRILLVDDHEMVRKGTATLLDQFSDLEVVGLASDGNEALEMEQQLHPDVLITDIRMPESSGIDLVTRLKTVDTNVKVLVLSAYDDEDYVVNLLKLGISGYLLKTVDVEELVQSIRLINSGETVIHSKIAERVARQLGRGETPKAPVLRLTPRETEVLELVVEGKTNVEIAGELKLSPRTVEVNMRNIFIKLNVNNRAEAVRFALMNNLFEKPQPGPRT